MELLKYLEKNYSVGEPIFLSDIKLPEISNLYLRQCFKELTDKNIISRYENGIYFFPKKTKLKNTCYKGLSSDAVAYSKYICRNNKIDGYYSGYTFANQIGISVQVPAHKEIVTNNIAAKRKDITLGKSIYILRHSKISVTEKNNHVLQLLDLLSNFDQYYDVSFGHAKEKVANYIKANKIKRNDIDSYIDFFPLSTYKFFYRLRLDYVLS